MIDVPTRGGLTYESVAPLLNRYRQDWCQWGRDVLRLKFTKDQQALVRSVQANKRTLGQSGHGCGKTFIAAFCATAYVNLYPYSRVIMTSSSQMQVRENLWAEFRRLYNRARPRLGPESCLLGTSLRYGEKWNVISAATKVPSNIQGGHNEFFMVVIDEAHAVDRGIWEALEGSISSESARMLAIYNPLTTAGLHYEYSMRPDLWSLVKLSCLRHPNVVYGKTVVPGAVTRDWLETAKRNWGEDSALFQARALGEFPDTSDDTLISLNDLAQAAATPLDVWLMMLDSGARDGTWLGVDVARSGSDSSWAVVLKDRKVIAEHKWSGQDLMYSCGRIHRMVEEFDIPWDQVNIDGIGVGAGVVDRLREQDLSVNDIQFGGKPRMDWEEDVAGVQLLNRRAELYWTGRTLLKNRKVVVPKKFDRIWADLMAPKYETKSSGQIKIEDKHEVKKRLGRSPDAGDAFILSLAREKNAAPSLSFVG